MWTAVTWHDEKNKRGRNVSDIRISRAPRASCWSKSEGPTLSSQIACAPCSYGPTSRVLVAMRHVSLWPYVPRPCGPTSRVPVALRPVSRRPMFLWPSVTCPYGLTSRVPVAVRPVPLWPCVPCLDASCSCGPASRVPMALRPASLWPYFPCPCGPASRVSVTLRPLFPQHCVPCGHNGRTQHLRTNEHASSPRVGACGRRPANVLVLRMRLLAAGGAPFRAYRPRYYALAHACPEASVTSFVHGRGHCVHDCNSSVGCLRAV